LGPPDDRVERTIVRLIACDLNPLTGRTIVRAGFPGGAGLPGPSQAPRPGWAEPNERSFALGPPDDWGERTIVRLTACDLNF